MHLHLPVTVIWIFPLFCYTLWLLLIIQFFVSDIPRFWYLVQLGYWCMCTNWVPKNNIFGMETETAWSHDIFQYVRNKKCGVDSSDTWGGPPTNYEHNKEPSLKLRLLSAGMLCHVFQYKFTNVSEEHWWISAGLQSIAPQKIVLFIITTMRISSATILKLLHPALLLDESNLCSQHNVYNGNSSLLHVTILPKMETE